MNEIKNLRNKLNMTVKELSKASGVAIGYISTLENDKKDISNPSKVVMTKIAKALDSTVPEVFF
ncbi:helix-turn-helix transcriptional regulator [Clostridium botulinum]|nr:XRE family transcriptional regulator [Clostridium botulinum]NFE93686.1 helix-turn-helix transcriptional regulator [Clostridium botulinum]NFL38436.1 helix-turn-helix transcriptional regulator [Clostridium botulinum]NFL65876.1 helix-turn-helix transcriptional regulator [Clostridium botulinum]NFN08273.1 helix-turn-helix transcriptional regulator [Clostridium botulinum]